MTVLPESPVREALKRVEALVVAKFTEPHKIPGPCKHLPVDDVWQGGVRLGLAIAVGIAQDEEPAPGTETTYFEYRVTGPGGAVIEWVDSYDRARALRLDWTVMRTADDLYIERRTVTVTQPVRLDDDGKPTS